ncbi:hypothetical protein C7959_101149 [Orenia marismortui]|uniref:Uncharacterized protein n=2 Tax=Orenia marismortui TaxID=46469 RepID=A0A4R8HGN4_9FIRM|nr:hypothetical protein C7959_101149 [Orenia marismortui]
MIRYYNNWGVKMDKFKKILVFGVVPILIIGLMILNANLQSKKLQDAKDNSIDQNNTKHINNKTELKQYDASIMIDKTAVTAKPGKKIKIALDIKNKSAMTWIQNKKSSINLSYHILNEKKEVILYDGLRTPIVKTVKSGEVLNLDAIVQVPDKAGIYYLEFDMVHRGVTWFGAKGSTTTLLKLEVE